MTHSTPSRRPRQLWGQHTRAWRERVSREISKQTGMTRRQIRDAFNRGTLKPATKNRKGRIPVRVGKRLAVERNLSPNAGYAKGELPSATTKQLAAIQSYQQAVDEGLEDYFEAYADGEDFDNPFGISKEKQEWISTLAA